MLWQYKCKENGHYLYFQKVIHILQVCSCSSVEMPPPDVLHSASQPKMKNLQQECGSGYFSTASASTPIASASDSIASAFTNKKRENER